MNILKYFSKKQELSSADEFSKILDSINWNPVSRDLINYPDDDESDSKYSKNYY
jgi:hypothetical protein